MSIMHVPCSAFLPVLCVEDVTRHRAETCFFQMNVRPLKNCFPIEPFTLFVEPFPEAPTSNQEEDPVLRKRL